MITITVTIDLYTYRELSEKAQLVALNDLMAEWMTFDSSIPDEAREAYDKAVRDSERMQTPWFCGEYVWDYCKVWILQALETYYFLDSGKFYKYIEE